MREPVARRRYDEVVTQPSRFLEPFNIHKSVFAPRREKGKVQADSKDLFDEVRRCRLNTSG